MVKARMNIMRLMRIQLKSGYVKVEPESYTFMKRYPPLTRDSSAPVRKIEVTTIPYLRLFEDAVAKNPKFLDERVYPAYWQQEPTALTLAKKQFELMKQGLSESDAYEGALLYTETLESSAFEELKKVIEKSGNEDSLKPLESDPAFVKSMKVFKALLSEVEYDDLDDKDQGEIDYVLQTKILKWSEVERERRMKDPVFAIEFDHLRKATFPELSKIAIVRAPEYRDELKSTLLKFFNVNEDKLCTNAPFYYDDYLYYFEKAKAEPLLGRWNMRDRQNYSRWITDTLAVREIVERSPTTVVQRYLDDLRAQFFPMVRYPDRANTFSLPDTEELKALLYANDVGYKNKDSKLFVQRVHKLPNLLFPKETFTTALLTNRKKLMDVMDDDSSMMKELTSAGLSAEAAADMKLQLKQYSGGSTGLRSDQAANLNMSALDRLVSQYDDDEYDESEDEKSGDSDEEKGKGKGGGGSESGSESDDDDSDGDEIKIKALRKGSKKIMSEVLDDNRPVHLGGLTIEEKRANKIFYSFINGREKKDMPAEEWERVVRQYYRQPTTELERVRESYRGNDKERAEAATTELDLSTIKDELVENDMITRARLSVIYETKEEARRAALWEERGVWDSELPQPSLRLE